MPIFHALLEEIEAGSGDGPVEEGDRIIGRLHQGAALKLECGAVILEPVRGLRTLKVSGRQAIEHKSGFWLLIERLLQIGDRCFIRPLQEIGLA
ncbi:MAG: hypothetical protein ABSD39_14310, partial [Terriglobales bacterium]